MIFEILKPTALWQRLLNSNNLSGRLAKGTIWIGLGNGLEQVTRLLRNIILTRIMAPEAFGLMAIVLAVNAAFESFTQVGIKEAVVHNPSGDQKEFLNGAWWLSFFRVISLYAVVFLASPWVARFYEKPELTNLMRIAFLSLLFNGFMSAQAYIAVKQMKFLKWTIIFHGGGVLGVLSAVVLGFYLQNVWALIIGFTLEGLSRCALSFFICPFLPRWRFNRTYLNSLFKYARGMIGLPILTFIFMRTDVFVIGRFFSFDNLGLYTMASAMAWLPFSFITRLIGQVMMPAFAERQSDKKLIKNWTVNSTSLIALISVPALAFLFTNGREVLFIIYGEPYSVMALPFVIVFSTALLRTCSVPIAAVYLALGMPEMHRLFTAIRAVLIVILIYPAIIWKGLEGAALAGLTSMIVSYGFQVMKLRQIISIEIVSYLKIFLTALLVSLPVPIVYFAAERFCPQNGYLAILPGAVGCIFSYLMVFKTVMNRIQYLRPAAKKLSEDK